MGDDSWLKTAGQMAKWTSDAVREFFFFFFVNLTQGQLDTSSLSLMRTCPQAPSPLTVPFLLLPLTPRLITQQTLLIFHHF